jgi:class 3 adenylate cyclase
MSACPTCGVELPPRAKFCLECGTKIDAPGATPTETRKVVTVLFSDVTGSTAIGERLDPEAVRGLMGRYFGAMRAVIESHGGTVEKFIGDAVMAVFGIPQLHEDDALRAVRSADEMRTALQALNADLASAGGVQIQTRTGITTGEVVVGDPAANQTLVTGDTVNTAARLEQAAQPGEVLIGEPTWRLVRDAVSAEQVEAVAAKGKADPVAAYRLVSVTAGAEGHLRRLDAPLVGREREMAILRQAFDAAVERRTPQLCTVFGTAGVGKSRLVAEFLAGLEGTARVLRGRCLPYGEGITYWPIREIVHAAAGIVEDDSPDAAEARLRDLVADEADAEARTRVLGAAIGLHSGAAQQEEIFWAVRRLLEDLSRREPLVVVVDDIHWAEETLLDLLEYIVDLGTDAPLLLLCPARPELLEARPGWGGNREASTVIHLEGLSGDACERLVEALPGGSVLPAGLRARILAAAEGNPLYVEEMLGMLVDDGYLVDGARGWEAAGDLDQLEVPLSVRALLSARIDSLPTAERRVAERASVVGRVFEAAAVRVLTEDLGRDVTGSLLSLVRKELVRPERSELSAGDAFKFRHLLIRDAAYDALPKRERAELHERFAHWLEEAAGDRITEYEEILGHHYQQACQYLRELGGAADRIEALGNAAGERLYAAGERAARRYDYAAARALMGAAAEIAPHHPRQGWWRLDFAEMVAITDPHAADPIYDELIERARLAGDDHLRARARTDQLGLEPRIRPEGFGARVESEMPALEEQLTKAGDNLGLTSLHGLRGQQLLESGRFDDSAEAMRTALEFAARHGDPFVEENGKISLLTAMGFGSAMPEETLRLSDEMLAGSPSKVFRTFVLPALGLAHATSGNVEEAMRLGTEVIDAHRELGMIPMLAYDHADLALYALWDGDPARAEAELVQAMDGFREMGADDAADYFLVGNYSVALLQQGRADEVRGILDERRHDLRVEDPRTPVLAAITDLESLVAVGRTDDAASLLATMDTSIAAIQGPQARSWALLRVARAAADLGEGELAARLAREALGVAESKGFVLGVQRATAFLAEQGETAG